MGTCGMYWEKSNTCRDWRGTLTEGDHFEDWHRWEDGIKLDVTEIGQHGIDWIHLAHVMYKW
jgi:hypothetical protein